MKRGKVLSIVTVAVMLVLALTFSSEVYATSRTTTLEVAGATRTAPTDGQQVLGERREGVVNDNVEVGQITNTQALNVLNDMNEVANVVNDAIVSNSESISNVTGESIPTERLTILASMEVTAKPGVEVSEKNPLFITFSFPGVVDSTKAFVCHFVNNKWVVVPTQVSEGIIIGKFTSLSPVAIVVDKSTLSSSVLGAGRAKSPRTGDNFTLIIAICLVGVVTSSAIAYKAKKRA